MTRWVLGTFRTGKIEAEVNELDGSWAAALNQAGSVSAKTELASYFDGDRRLLDIWSYTVPWKHFMAAIDGDLVHEAGPILSRPFADDEGRELSINAAGMWAYLTRRVTRPPFGPDQTLADVELRFEPEERLEKGTIAKRIIQAMLAVPGGDVPIDLPDDRFVPEGQSGTKRVYPGYEGAYIADRLNQLVEVINGPDVMFRPYLADATHIRWRMVTGTDADPYVHNAGTPVFDYSAPLKPVSNLQISENGQRFVSISYQIGAVPEPDVPEGQEGDDGTTDDVGETADVEALPPIAQSVDMTLVEEGWPLLEEVTSRDSVSVLSTLQGYADERTAQGKRAPVLFTFDFPTNERPYPSTYAVGDWCKLVTKGHPRLSDGAHLCRIVGLASDTTYEKISITFQEVEVV